MQAGVKAQEPGGFNAEEEISKTKGQTGGKEETESRNPGGYRKANSYPCRRDANNSRHPGQDIG